MSEHEKMIPSAEHSVDIPEGEQPEKKAPKTMSERVREATWYSMNNIPTVLLIFFGLLSVLFFLLSLVGLTGYCLYLGIIGLIGVSLGTGQQVQLGSMAKQIDRFRLTNDELEATTSTLTSEVDELEHNNNKLQQNVKMAEEHVEQLKDVADGMHEKLEQFMTLNDKLQKMAKSTGQDVSQLLAQSQKMRNDAKQMTLENERALLGQISQDLEFSDGKAGMSRDAFDRFCRRVPRHLQAKLKAMNMDYDKLAGADKVVDYEEMQQFINDLLSQNTDKKDQLETDKSKKEVPSLL